jgi:hypothetical protein
VWVKIESAAVKVDRCLEVLDVPQPASRFLHPLDGGVQVNLIYNSTQGGEQRIDLINLFHEVGLALLERPG